MRPVREIKCEVFGGVWGVLWIFNAGGFAIHLDDEGGISGGLTSIVRTVKDMMASWIGAWKYTSFKIAQKQNKYWNFDRKIDEGIVMIKDIKQCKYQMYTLYLESLLVHLVVPSIGNS